MYYDPKFIYFRRNGGVIVVAYRLLEDKSNNKLRVVYDISQCSPLDRFSKKRGRNMALGRLDSRLRKLREAGMVDEMIDLTIDDDRTRSQYPQVAAAIEYDLFQANLNVLPNWARRKDIREVSEFTRELNNLLDKHKNRLTRREMNASHELIEYKVAQML
jgi:hypothetical protein